MYALTDGAVITSLVEGKNVIGRSAVPVEGVAFISLESPRAAISRMQAFIEVAANGDAWIADCNSTNGTFLAVRDGTGVRLEPNHYYQLSPGCRIVFGDVERQFVCASASNPDGEAGTAKATTPYLDAHDVVRAGTEGSHGDHSKLARSRSTPDREHDDGAPPRKAPRTRSTTVARASVEPLAPFVACFTGMDGTEKGDAKKSMKRLGGRTVDDVLKANLLVVKAPSTRTPKFLIAVGRGIPIATEKVLDADALTLESIEACGASLHHDESHYYSVALLQKAIHRTDHLPILEGLSFNLADLPAKLRASAQEVIVGCGGEVQKAKKKGATVLSEKSLNELYDSILHGKRPTL